MRTTLGLRRSHRILIDLRSDSSSPAPRSLRAAWVASGVDLFSEDRETWLLESEVADLLDKEAGLFVPSGVMANQLGIAALTDEDAHVVSGTYSHIGLFESSQPLRRLHLVEDLGDIQGYLTAALKQAEHDKSIGAITTENTHANSGGIAHRSSAYQLLREGRVPVHLDGARLMNAAVATGESMAALSSHATTVTFTLSKGFGAPVGSVLAGPGDVIARARRIRLAVGGAMAKPGSLAAAARVAMKRPASAFLQDHANAARLRRAVEHRWPGAVHSRGALPTNLVFFSVDDPLHLISQLRVESILVSAAGDAGIRLVTHGGIRSHDISRVVSLLAKL